MTEVTCLYCRAKIFKEDSETVRVGTRYAHRTCAEKRATEPKKEKKEKTDSKPKKANIKKCLYCGGDIDISVEDYRMPRTNRYAHKKCYEEHYNPDEDYIGVIYSFLKEEVGISYDYQQCERQRVSFIQKHGYTNEGIYNALRYFYLVKKQSPEKSGNRIGIVPYVYNEAKEYYETIAKKKKQIERGLKTQVEKGAKVMVIRGPERERDKGLIDLDTIGGE